MPAASTTTSSSTGTTTTSSSSSSRGPKRKQTNKSNNRTSKKGNEDCCCSEPFPTVYKPGFGCFERVKGPFQKPIPTPYDEYLKKYCHVRKEPVSKIQNDRNNIRGGGGGKSWPCNKNGGWCATGPPPCPPYMLTKFFNGAGCKNNCDGAREQKVCQAELQRLREERWKEQERKAIMEDKRRQEWMQEQYKSQVRQWEEAQSKCEQDQERRAELLKQIKCQRREVTALREEAKAWRTYQKQRQKEQMQNQQMSWANDYSQREDERRWEQEKIRMRQEDKLMYAQVLPRNTECMAVPELEEIRRMFVPAGRGPNETFEYFLVEPRPTTAEMKKSAELKMAALMGFRDSNGIHLNLSDRLNKKTTISLAMGPKLVGGERNQFCNVTSQPGACTPKSGCSMPNVPVPTCLGPLMQTLSYRVKNINSPLLRMETTGPQPGPNFAGSKLYGTVVIPKGNMLAPYYTDQCAVTF